MSVVLTNQFLHSGSNLSSVLISSCHFLLADLLNGGLSSWYISMCAHNVSSKIQKKILELKHNFSQEIHCHKLKLQYMKFV